MYSFNIKYFISLLTKSASIKFRNSKRYKKDFFKSLNK